MSGSLLLIVIYEFNALDDWRLELQFSVFKLLVFLLQICKRGLFGRET